MRVTINQSIMAAQMNVVGKSEPIFYHVKRPIRWSNHNTSIQRSSASGLGLIISSQMSPWGNPQSAVVTGFRGDNIGTQGRINIGDVICGVNGNSVEMLSFFETVKIISEATSPVCLAIFRSIARYPLFNTIHGNRLYTPLPEAKSLKSKPPRQRPDGIPIVTDMSESITEWYDSRKQLWRALSRRNKRPWPSCNPEFMPIEASEDSNELLCETSMIPEWQRPLGVPFVQEWGSTAEDRSQWLEARKCLWKAISCRNGHPWPSEDPCFVGDMEEEDMTVTPEWLAWLAKRKTCWKEIASERCLKRKRIEAALSKDEANQDKATSWVFNCSCGLLDVEGFDDGSTQWECPRCHRWAHTECIKKWYRATYLRRLSLQNYTECFSCAVARAKEEGTSLPILPLLDGVKEDQVKESSKPGLKLKTRSSKQNRTRKVVKVSLLDTGSSLSAMEVEMIKSSSDGLGQCRLVADDFPDDSLVMCLRFLPKESYLILLLVSMKWRTKLKKRNELWQVLCLDQLSWRSRLPSRARKPWYEIFRLELNREIKMRSLASDELLRKAWILLRKGDNLVAIKKLVDEGERKFNFSLNYCSGVMLEANPLLNMALIQKRVKVSKWLIIERRVDVNICDKGGFSPLMDVAWYGDLNMTRLLLQFGADPHLKGQSHFSGGIKLHGPIMDAAKWASHKGHAEVNDLIVQWQSASPEYIATVRARAVAEIASKH